MNYYLGIDLGGTNIRCGVVDENYRVLGIGNVKTDLPKTPDEIVIKIEEGINLALAESKVTLEEISNIGIGMPGTIDSELGIVKYASNFGFTDVPLGELMTKKMGKPIFLANDANTAIYGEMLDGSAKGCKDVVMITLGTGVGGGILIDGKIYTGSNSLGAELGHVGMVFDGEQCLCGLKGCVEVYCSATALIKQTKCAMEQNPTSLLWKIVEGDLKKVDGQTAFIGAELGDKSGLEVVKKYEEYLGYAVTSFINIFQPQAIVIGGGVSLQGETLAEPVREYVKKNALGQQSEDSTKICIVQHGNESAVVGAAFLFRQFSNK